MSIKDQILFERETFAPAYHGLRIENVKRFILAEIILGTVHTGIH